MTQTEPWTIGRLLEWTKKYLAEHGAESPRLDAEVLLAHARHCERIELYTAFDDIAADDVRSHFRDLVRRRASGIPVAYLVEHREFYSLTFRVTPDVLIPRPETEFLVVRFLDLAKVHPHSPSLSVADVGTGSGILAVCAAHALRDCHVVATDLSRPALEVAEHNATQHGVVNRIEFLCSDLLEGVAASQQFDFILSNPPYVSQDEFDKLPKHVRDFEPRLALVGGVTGTEVVERLIEQASSRLRPQGWLVMEVSPMIAPSVEGLLRSHPDFSSVRVTKDLAQHPRIVEACRSGA